MNRSLKDIQPSATLTLAAKAKALRAEGKDVLSFTAGEPDFDTPDHIKQAAKKALDEGRTKYTPVAGIPELRDAVVEKFKKENNLEYIRDEVMVANGGKQACYNFLLTICNSGDEVLIPSPFWVSYPEMVRLCNAVPVFTDTDEGIVRAEILEKYLTEKTRVLILNSPSNPTGAVIPKEELEKIAALAVKHDFYILSDEVYEHLLYEGEHVSIASFNEEIKKRTLTLGACSKTYSMTGWRLGFCAGPKNIIKAMTIIQSHTTSNPSSIGQYAALAALTGPQEPVRKMREAFTRRRKLILTGLEEAGLTCIQPGGAFYVFANITSSGLSSSEFAQQLLEKELVAVVPGKPFGSDDYVRLSYACSDEHITEGIQRIKRFLGKSSLD